MPFLSPTSRNHSLDLILSLTTKTEGEGASFPLCWLSDASNLKKTWWDCVKNYMESLGLFQKDAQFRNKQLRRVKGAVG